MLHGKEISSVAGLVALVICEQVMFHQRPCWMIYKENDIEIASIISPGKVLYHSKV